MIHFSTQLTFSIHFKTPQPGSTNMCVFPQSQLDDVWFFAERKERSDFRAALHYYALTPAYWSYLRINTLKFLRMIHTSRPGDQHWLDQVTTNQTWLFQSMTHFSNLSYLRKKWPFLVLDIWKLGTNLLIKAVTQFLFFSGVTAFNSLSADFESRLMPRSGYDFDTKSN